MSNFPMTQNYLLPSNEFVSFPSYQTSIFSTESVINTGLIPWSLSLRRGRSRSTSGLYSTSYYPLVTVSTPYIQLLSSSLSQLKLQALPLSFCRGRTRFISGPREEGPRRCSRWRSLCCHASSSRSRHPPTLSPPTKNTPSKCAPSECGEGYC